MGMVVVVFVHALCTCLCMGQGNMSYCVFLFVAAKWPSLQMAWTFARESFRWTLNQMKRRQQYKLSHTQWFLWQIVNARNCFPSKLKNVTRTNVEVPGALYLVSLLRLTLMMQCICLILTTSSLVLCMVQHILQGWQFHGAAQQASSVIALLSVHFATAEGLIGQKCFTLLNNSTMWYNAQNSLPVFHFKTQ